MTGAVSRTVPSPATRTPSKPPPLSAWPTTSHSEPLATTAISTMLPAYSGASRISNGASSTVPSGETRAPKIFLGAAPPVPDGVSFSQMTSQFCPFQAASGSCWEPKSWLTMIGVVSISVAARVEAGGVDVAAALIETLEVGVRRTHVGPDDQKAGAARGDVDVLLVADRLARRSPCHRRGSSGRPAVEKSAPATVAHNDSAVRMIESRTMKFRTPIFVVFCMTAPRPIADCSRSIFS